MNFTAIDTESEGREQVGGAGPGLGAKDRGGSLPPRALGPVRTGAHTAATTGTQGGSVEACHAVLRDSLPSSPQDPGHMPRVLLPRGTHPEQVGFLSPGSEGQKSERSLTGSNQGSAGLVPSGGCRANLFVPFPASKAPCVPRCVATSLRPLRSSPLPSLTCSSCLTLVTTNRLHLYERSYICREPFPCHRVQGSQGRCIFTGHLSAHQQGQQPVGRAFAGCQALP